MKMQSFFIIGAIMKIPMAWVLVVLFDSWRRVILANIMAFYLYCTLYSRNR